MAQPQDLYRRSGIVAERAFVDQAILAPRLEIYAALIGGTGIGLVFLIESFVFLEKILNLLDSNQDFQLQYK